MTEFWKASAMIILAVILCSAVGRTEKDIAVVLSVTVCCMVAVTVVRYLSESVEFIWELYNSSMQSNLFLETLLKITGVAILSEVISLLCADSGNTSLGKIMQHLGNSMILVLSIPIFETFFSMVQEILRIA